MKKIGVLFLLLCFLCACASTGKQAVDTDDGSYEPGKSSSGIKANDIENALKINCAVGNVLACIFQTPFIVKDAVNFISDVTKKSENADTKKEDEK